MIDNKSSRGNKDNMNKKGNNNDNDSNDNGNDSESGVELTCILNCLIKMIYIDPSSQFVLYMLENEINQIDKFKLYLTNNLCCKVHFLYASLLCAMSRIEDCDNCLNISNWYFLFSVTRSIHDFLSRLSGLSFANLVELNNDMLISSTLDGIDETNEANDSFNCTIVEYVYKIHSLLETRANYWNNLYFSSKILGNAQILSQNSVELVIDANEINILLAKLECCLLMYGKNHGFIEKFICFDEWTKLTQLLKNQPISQAHTECWQKWDDLKQRVSFESNNILNMAFNLRSMPKEFAHCEFDYGYDLWKIGKNVHYGQIYLIEPLLTTPYFLEYSDYCDLTLNWESKYSNNIIFPVWEHFKMHGYRLDLQSKFTKSGDVNRKIRAMKCVHYGLTNTNTNYQEWHTFSLIMCHSKQHLIKLNHQLLQRFEMYLNRINNVDSVDKINKSTNQLFAGKRRNARQAVTDINDSARRKRLLINRVWTKIVSIRKKNASRFVALEMYNDNCKHVQIMNDAIIQYIVNNKF